MNTLTKNRIIQQGDEYSNGKEWRPVPETDWGLQVLFTNYSQVRRPSESLRETPETAKDAPTEAAELPESPTPISPDSGEHPAAKAESDTQPLPLVTRGQAVIPDPGIAVDPGLGKSITAITKKLLNVLNEPPEPSSYLPTVVSPKAHREERERFLFPEGSHCVWTGRNGTFTGYGLDIRVLEEKVSLWPRGKRGVCNCIIQFPVSIIPQLTEWLNKHRDKSK